MTEEQIVVCFKDLAERVSALEEKQDEILVHLHADREVTIDNNNNLWPYLHEHLTDGVTKFQLASEESV